MDDTGLLISGIDSKVRKLVKGYNKIQDQYKTASEKEKELENTVLIQKKQITELEKKIEVLKITKTLNSSEGTVEVKQKINTLVREIDKCIKQLNK